MDIAKRRMGMHFKPLQCTQNRKKMFVLAENALTLRHLLLNGSDEKKIFVLAQNAFHTQTNIFSSIIVINLVKGKKGDTQKRNNGEKWDDTMEK